MSPFFSIIIPTYNRAHVLRKAIDSVVSNPYKDFEIVVVDDGSTDDTQDLFREIDDLKIQVVWQTNKGVSAARNNGAMHAKGSFFIFLDSDDRLSDNYLEIAHRILSVKTCELLIGYSQFERPDVVAVKKFYPWMEGDKFHHPLTGAFVISRDWFAWVGGYDENLAFSETSDLFLRLSLSGLMDSKHIVSSEALGVHIQMEDSKQRKLRHSTKRYESVKYFVEKHKLFLESSTKDFLNYKRIHALYALQYDRFDEATACLEEIVNRVPTSIKSRLHYYFVLMFPHLAKMYYGR